MENETDKSLFEARCSTGTTTFHGSELQSNNWGVKWSDILPSGKKASSYAEWAVTLQLVSMQATQRLSCHRHQWISEDYSHSEEATDGEQAKGISCPHGSNQRPSVGRDLWPPPSVQSTPLVSLTKQASLWHLLEGFFRHWTNFKMRETCDRCSIYCGKQQASALKKALLGFLGGLRLWVVVHRVDISHMKGPGLHTA